MPIDDFDFDPTESDLRIGIELEFPEFDPDEDELYVSRGRDSSNLNREMGGMPTHLDARQTYDGTVGLEIVSDVLHLEDAPQWYAHVVEHMREEWNAHLQPTGLMDTGNTAGLHMHLSSLDREFANDLYEISQTPWAKVLFCSSIANANGEAAWPVFRGGRYCQMNGGVGGGHYDCVNDRGNGRYEWRMPEPMDPEHIEVVVRFLRLMEQDTDAAIEYAQEVLDSGDDRITAIKRAEAVGMDLDDVPRIERQMAESDPEAFFETVRRDWAYPEIYTVEMRGSEFYAFDSRLNGEFEAEGVRFHPDDILRADSLDPVTDDELADDIRRAFQRRNSGEVRETEATEELKKIVKKKKGKPVEGN